MTWPHWWPEPAAGDIVWCHFPVGTHGTPKPRPALIIEVLGLGPRWTVTVAYGTSQRTTSLFSGEFSILKASNPAAYRAAGLSADTKFDLRRRVDLPYNDTYFKVPPTPAFGQIPQLGTLHASLSRAVVAANQALQG